jgi:hypothetical protein
MKIYKYWVVEKQKILVDGVAQEVTSHKTKTSEVSQTSEVFSFTRS